MEDSVQANIIAIPFPRDIHILPKIGIYPSQLYVETCAAQVQCIYPSQL